MTYGTWQCPLSICCFSSHTLQGPCHHSMQKYPQALCINPRVILSLAQGYLCGGTEHAQLVACKFTTDTKVCKFCIQLSI